MVQIKENSRIEEAKKKGDRYIPENQVRSFDIQSLSEIRGTYQIK